MLLDVSVCVCVSLLLGGADCCVRMCVVYKLVRKAYINVYDAWKNIEISMHSRVVGGWVFPSDTADYLNQFYKCKKNCFNINVRQLFVRVVT